MMHRAATLSPPSPSLYEGPGARIGRLTALLAGAALAAALGSPSSVFAQNASDLNRALTNLEGDAQRLVNLPVRVEPPRSDTFVEERLTDGELYLRLDDNLRAAILFTDIVENHSSHRAYPEALFLLGESLFAAGDNLGARRRYEAVLDQAASPGFQPFVERSLSRLIQIAVETQDFRAIDSYFQTLEALPRESLQVSTAYFRAKYLYNRAVPIAQVINAPSNQPIVGIDPDLLEQARKGFLGIPSGTDYSLRARYFAGTIYVLRTEYDDAIASFRSVLGEVPINEVDSEVTDLAHLALGRVYYETAQLDQAVDAYRAIEQGSSQFDRALYELAWTYIAKGDAVQAERALEVLSVASPDSPLNADGKVLRGELLARAARYNEAEAVFDEVLEEFGPIRDDLDRITVEHTDLAAYFRQLVTQNLEGFDIDDFLPPTAQKWVLVEGEYERALGVLQDLSDARALTEDTEELAARIENALRGPNEVAVFPDLRRQRERTTGIRNQLAQLRGDYLDVEERGLNPERVSQQAENMGSQRASLERQVDALPTTTEDFIDRDLDKLSEYQALEQELQGLRVEILGLQARIVASKTGMLAIDPDKVDPARIEAELAAQEAQIVEYEAELEAIRGRLEVGRLHTGVGDSRYAADAVLRDDFNRLVAAQRRAEGLTGSLFDSAYARMARVEASLDRHDAEIEAAVAKRASRMTAVVNEEKVNLRRYREALRGLEGETEEVVGTIAYLNFERILKRFDQLVLRANVGRIDVAWAQREDHRLRIDTLTRERAREIQALDDEFREVMDDVEYEESP